MRTMRSVVADAERVVPVPASMSNSTAAQLLSNPLTAVILTGDQLDVQPLLFGL